MPPTPPPCLWHGQHFVVLACLLVCLPYQAEQLWEGDLSLRRTKESRLWQMTRGPCCTGDRGKKQRYLCGGEETNVTSSSSQVYNPDQSLSHEGRERKWQNGISSVDDGGLWISESRPCSWIGRVLVTWKPHTTPSIGQPPECCWSQVLSSEKQGVAIK